MVKIISVPHNTHDKAALLVTAAGGASLRSSSSLSSDANIAVCLVPEIALLEYYNIRQISNRLAVAGDPTLLAHTTHGKRACTGRRRSGL
jgi:hypothetical protein